MARTIQQLDRAWPSGARVRVVLAAERQDTDERLGSTSIGKATGMCVSLSSVRARAAGLATLSAYSAQLMCGTSTDGPLFLDAANDAHSALMIYAKLLAEATRMPEPPPPSLYTFDVIRKVAQHPTGEVWGPRNPRAPSLPEVTPALAQELVEDEVHETFEDAWGDKPAGPPVGEITQVDASSAKPIRDNGVVHAEESSSTLALGIDPTYSAELGSSGVHYSSSGSFSAWRP